MVRCLTIPTCRGARLILVLEDDIALAAAASFTTVALLSILYTAYTFVWRVFKIRFVFLLFP